MTAQDRAESVRSTSRYGLCRVRVLKVEIGQTLSIAQEPISGYPGFSQISDSDLFVMLHLSMGVTLTDDQGETTRLERRLVQIRKLINGPFELSEVRRLKQEEIDIVARLYSLRGGSLALRD